MITNNFVSKDNGKLRLEITFPIKINDFEKYFNLSGFYSHHLWILQTKKRIPPFEYLKFNAMEITVWIYAGNIDILLFGQTSFSRNVNG